MWWFTSVISATQEAEVGGLQLETDLGKTARPYPKTNLNKKQKKKVE
jgi:hypothetical protein